MVNATALLSFMLGATDTTNGPEVAPVGIVMLILVAVHEFTVIEVLFSSTALLPCVLPKPVPVIVTWLPIDPVVAEVLLMTGAGTAAELTETLSNAAVARVELPLFTASPISTFCAMLIV